MTLEALLAPRSIAILGASADLSKINGRPLKFLLEKRYAGRIYPVNPKYREISGVTCYASIADLPEAPDLAIVAVPAKYVVDAIRQLGTRGVKAAVVFSSGFAEMGADGKAAENALKIAARDAGVRLCGPNCLGIINAFDNVIATFGQYADGATMPGPVGFVTQSGAFGTAIAALARRRAIGLGYFINTGNETDLDFVQVMRAVLDDPRIRVGAGYIEGLKDGRGFMELAEYALENAKPLIVTKVGRSESGARAAASHTGSLAGSDVVFDGVARGAGVIRARNEEQMLDFTEVLSLCGLPEGRGVAIVTQSGGAGVLMADRAEEVGIEVAKLNEPTRARLKRVIPAFGTSSNPVDITGQFVAEPALLREAVRIVLEDPAVHVGIVWLQLMDAHVETLLAIFDEIKRAATKPWVVCWVAAPDAALKGLRERGIPVLRGAEAAVEAIAALVQFSASRRRWIAEKDARARVHLPSTGHVVRAAEAIGVLPSLTARDLLERAGVRTPATKVAKTVEEAIAAADEIGYPVALKIESADIPHKTQANAVALRLGDADAVRRAFVDVIASARAYDANARIGGVLVQRMLHGGVELVIGLKNDDTFDPVVMVGLGGVYVEVLKDVVFRKAPVTRAEADHMLDELKARAILGGVRGRPPVNREAMIQMISATSRLAAALGERLVELDLNPVLCDEYGAVAVDWLVVLR